MSDSDETDYHVMAQDISHHWQRPEEIAIAYQAAAEAIKRMRRCYTVLSLASDDLQALHSCGYAPGNYTCQCYTCEAQFDGVKDAKRCRKCATKTYFRSLISREGTTL